MGQCRFFQRMTGDLVETASDDSAPAVQQLCVVSCQAAAVALDWTQKGDGLLVADVSGGIIMYRVACQLSSQPLASTQSGVGSVSQNVNSWQGWKDDAGMRDGMRPYMQGCGASGASKQAPQGQTSSSCGRPLLQSRSRCCQAGKALQRPPPLPLRAPKR